MLNTIVRILNDGKSLESFFYKSNRLQQLRGFTCAAQFGNISRAAKHLRMSPASISVQIKSLERDLEIELFVRKGPKIELTGDGRRLLELALPLVEGLDEIPVLFQKAAEEIKRTELKIAANTTTLNFILPKLLTRLLSRFPDIHVDVHHAEHDEAIEKIRKRAVDLALLPKREHKPMSEDMKFTEAYRYKAALITRPDHPLAGRKRLTVKEISKYELTLPSKELRVIPNLYEIFPQHNIQKRLRIRFVNWETTRKYIEAGLAISISSDVIIEENDQLVATPLGHLFPDVVYGFVTSKRRAASDNAARIIKVAGSG